MKTVYLDGVFDMFHRGHLTSFLVSKEAGKEMFGADEDIQLVIGVVSDSDCESYKRKPIINEQDRVAIVSHIREVDRVIFPAPLVVTKEFIEKEGIDLVVHGFSSPEDREKQRAFFQLCMDMGKFKEIPYTSGISTTQLLAMISQRQ